MSADRESLNARATVALADLVSRANGPADRGRIPTDHIGVLKELLTAWVMDKAEPHEDGWFVRSSGCWHAFDDLVPLEKTNRWDPLRKDVLADLERDGWRRQGGIRGSQFVIPAGLVDQTSSMTPANEGRPMFILTWNPDAWGGDEFWAELVEGLPESLEGTDAMDRWSTGNRSSEITPGDHAILLRQGRERGLLGVGTFVSECYEEEHWNEEGGSANYADVEWEMLSAVDDRIPTEDLIDEFPEVAWNSLFSSGVRVEPDLAQRILDRWWIESEDEDTESGLPSSLPDPDDERKRLQGLETWAHYMLSSLLAGGRPPGQNRAHAPSDLGAEVIRTIDEQCFEHSRPDEPLLFWEFKLDGRPEDPYNGWPDIAFVWPDRVVIVELKTDAGSIRDGQLEWYVDLAAANYPDAQVDLLFVTKDSGYTAFPSMPERIRFANLTWVEIVEALTGLLELVEPGDRAVIERYVLLLESEGILLSERASPNERSQSAGFRAELAAEWLPQAIELAEATARDGRHRALDVEFESWDQIDIAAGVVRDALEATSFAQRVLVWRWRPKSGGTPRTPAGETTGVELRFSQLQR